MTLQRINGSENEWVDKWMDGPKSISTFSNRGCNENVCFSYSNQNILSAGLFWHFLRRKQFKKSAKDWMTCHDPNRNPSGVSMCLSLPLCVETQWRTPLLRPVSVCVFCLFTMIVFVVKTKAIITVTSASFSDHKTSNTHENARTHPKSHPDTRLLRRERAWGRERSKGWRGAA